VSEEASWRSTVKSVKIAPSSQEGCAEDRCEEIIGRSPAFKVVLAEVERVAPTDATVLVLGETGTGKEVIARAIHESSPRSGRPFIKLNCAAIPFDLLESELFGHERGAFTGAFTQKSGRFEMADTGTLLLDEIGDIPLALQPKLLRVLQEREFERLGSGKPRRIDVRVVAATHRNLSELVGRKLFRSDLYYRLNVFPIVLPPLRERREDIPPLVSHFVEVFARRMGRSISEIPRRTLDSFTSYSWPGNVRELQNVIERAVILSEHGVLADPIREFDSNPVANLPNPEPVVMTSAQEGSFRESQRACILHALEAAGWVVGGSRGAAARLGLNRTTLIGKMKRFGISRPVVRDETNEMRQPVELR
jgi:formate hydrogenlyase transcriptional activator